MRNLFIAGLTLLALIVGSVAAFGVAEDAEDAPPVEAPPASVYTATVRADTLSGVIEAVGTAQAFESVTITPSVTETLGRLHFEEGQEVRRGQVLASLVQAEERAALEAARATLTEEEREVERLEQLTAEGAVAEVRLEERRTQFDVAVRRVEEAQARLADRTLRAPFDGVTGLRRVSPGALVTPGTPITTLDDLQSIKLDFTVPEIRLGALREGQEVRATSDAFPGRVFTGSLTLVDPRVDPVTRAASARAVLPNSDRALRSGMLLRVVLTTSQRPALVVPERAIVPVQDRAYVFVLDEAAGGEEARSALRTEVEVGERQFGFVEVLAGLEAGQRVVTQGLQQLGAAERRRVRVRGEFAGPAEPFRGAQQERSAGASGEGVGEDDRLRTP